MSIYTECPRGQNYGILIIHKELLEFSNFMKSKYLDEFIPIPNIQNSQQRDRIKNCTYCDDEGTNSEIYWEVEETGKHGWCCKFCGKVCQWG